MYREATVLTQDVANPAIRWPYSMRTVLDVCIALHILSNAAPHEMHKHANNQVVHVTRTEPSFCLQSCISDHETQQRASFSGSLCKDLHQQRHALDLKSVSAWKAGRKTLDS